MNGPALFAYARRAVLPLALTAGALTGCGGGETDTSATTSGTTETSACNGDTRAQAYAVGLSESSADGAVTITFVDADPAPPAKGNNTWTVKITGKDGQPLSGAAIETTAYMPDHGHTSPIKPTATEKDPGTYEVTPVNLFMAGVWEVTLAVTPAGGSASPVKFTFCVAG